MLGYCLFPAEISLALWTIRTFQYLTCPLPAPISFPLQPVIHPSISVQVLELPATQSGPCGFVRNATVASSACKYLKALPWGHLAVIPVLGIWCFAKSLHDIKIVVWGSVTFYLTPHLPGLLGHFHFISFSH